MFIVDDTDVSIMRCLQNNVISFILRRIETM